MNKKTIAYWIATGLFCTVFTIGGIANLVRWEHQVEIMQTLGYPLYLMTILGVAKLLGVVAVLIPRFPTLKEWAYAGFAFDMLGAAASHVFVADPVAETVAPLVILAIGAASYLTRPASRRHTFAGSENANHQTGAEIQREKTNRIFPAACVTFAMLFALPAFSQNVAQESTDSLADSIKVEDFDQNQLAVKKAIDDLIQTATTYDVEQLERIYHDDLEVTMIGKDGKVDVANKEAFKNMFQSMKKAGAPPMNTWARFHVVDATDKVGHVALSRKNNLSGEEQLLLLSIDLVFEDGRWQVTREVIFLRPIK